MTLTNSTLPQTTEIEEDTLKLAVLNAQLCQDKIAKDVFILDLKEAESAPADYFVICSCDSTAQVQATVDLIQRTVRDYKLTRPRVEGFETGEWAVLDYFNIIVHVMLEEVRNHFKLEKLWGDSTFYTVNEEAEISKVDYEEVLRIYN